MSYFAIERNRNCMDHVVIKDNDGNVMFKNYLNMSYDEMKSSEDLAEFVVAVMDAASKSIEGDNGQMLVTLVGDDDVFIWKYRYSFSMLYKNYAQKSDFADDFGLSELG